MTRRTEPRPHGRTKYVVEKCHCDTCRDDHIEYERHRRRMRAYGREAYVDATPVRQHVNQLRASGMGWKTIAQCAGVRSSVMWKLLYGDPQRNLAPSKRVRPTTAEKILAVQFDPSLLADGCLVDGTGTARRLRALVALGWSQNRISAQMGISRENFQHTISGRPVRARTARSAAALYERLWNTAPPESEHRERIAASRARNHARNAGWLPPMAWDDETIDDPNSTPDAYTGDGDFVDEVVVELLVSGKRAQSTEAERLAAARVLVAQERRAEARRLLKARTNSDLASILGGAA